jgi:hypothetical protein
MSPCEHEFIVSIFQIYLPLIVGQAEEAQTELEKLKSVRAECIAQFIITPGRMQGFIEALQTNFDTYIARFGEPADTE